MNNQMPFGFPPFNFEQNEIQQLNNKLNILDKRIKKLEKKIEMLEGNNYRPYQSYPNNYLI